MNYQNNLNSDELERYQRHINLREIGLEGQIKLKNSSVIFIGAGGLGSAAILYIAAAGIGKIGIVDNDHIEKSNLQRQIIHNNDDIGNQKTDSARKRINQLNPNCEITTFSERLSVKNVLNILNKFDIVCDCSDNFSTRYLVNDASMILNKPIIFGSVQGFEGQISVFNLNKNSPNLRDLIPNPPKNNEIPSCNEFGVIGVSPGLIGILQANEIIKIIIKRGNILDGKILIFNLLNMSMKKLTLKPNFSKQIKDLVEYKSDYSDQEFSCSNIEIKKISNIEFKHLHKTKFNQIIILDVREKDEFNKFSINGSISLPLSLIQQKNCFEFLKNNSKGKSIYTLCQKGKRSEKASKILSEENIQSISIEGGLDELGEIN